MHAFNGSYDGEHLNHTAFPLGGLGAGMVCLDGVGSLSHVSLRNKPDILNQPQMYAAVCLRQPEGNVARVLEGPVLRHKVFGSGGAGGVGGTGKGSSTFGLPRFTNVAFEPRMPFATVRLDDPSLPIAATLTGFSPFIPNDGDNSSLPAAALEYELTNTSPQRVEGVFSYHAINLMKLHTPDTPDPAAHRVRRIDNGFVLSQSGRPEAIHEEGHFAITALASDVHVDAAWFRGGWFDAWTLVWNHVQAGDVVDNWPHDDGGLASSGASLYVPFALEPGASTKVTLLLNWYVPNTQDRYGKDPDAPTACCDSGCACETQPEAKPKYQPWYAGRFAEIDQAVTYWRRNYADLREKSQIFADSFYATTLPAEVVEAVAANLTILKSPTVLRQTDGRVWAWEGCGDQQGCCHGSCTHVWNYAQALPHLFPALERTLRDTEFGESQNSAGKQVFRATLPIRPCCDFSPHAAADGQLGGVMKVHREWRICGDDAWLRQLWPAVRKSLDYCIEAWDPTHEGVLREPHHNTYDIEFWGPNGMCSSFYLGALRAAAIMGETLGDDVSFYDELYRKGRAFVETELFNGEYFVQHVQWTGLKADVSKFTPQCHTGIERTDTQKFEAENGPKYQYGTGCLSDGVLGAWMAEVCGVGEILDPEKVKSHLLAVHRHNLKHDLTQHANPQRPGYALGDEGGLLLCTWPRGGKPALPFVYSDEVWTGIEYQVAAHLASFGCVDEALDIVRTLRLRYDGRFRNPFNEYECGHWYARAMASYALLSGLSGASYEPATGVLTLAPKVSGDFAAFFSTATGFGLVGVRAGQPFCDVRFGAIDVKRMEYHPA